MYTSLFINKQQTGCQHECFELLKNFKTFNIENIL